MAPIKRRDSNRARREHSASRKRNRNCKIIALYGLCLSEIFSLKEIRKIYKQRICWAISILKTAFHNRSSILLCLYGHPCPELTFHETMTNAVLSIPTKPLI